MAPVVLQDTIERAGFDLFLAELGNMENDIADMNKKYDDDKAEEARQAEEKIRQRLERELYDAQVSVEENQNEAQLQEKGSE